MSMMNPVLSLYIYIILAYLFAYSILSFCPFIGKYWYCYKTRSFGIRETDLTFNPTTYYLRDPGPNT